ncbi:thymopoietin b [Sphaeramia orbicularis]|uniref:Lamina-associated polypeptide 2, isoforms beta/delta/epsilon/gamma-like n=1 Tax=Sphaeramia orbicularis TaxID=375764 RepID=A0A673BWA9_9TELE|nr:lamina-associated polypeptide 2, isoforms beta/delta/epsilon/gamma-like [Sphaeramia orbicularis]
MAEFLEDPSVLTKDELRDELRANNVRLPSGVHKKEVYVQLYLKNLTILNNKKSPPADTFSSDEELPAPVVSNKSRSGRKATKKTDKPRTEEVEVTDLTDEDLKQQLAKHGVESGPIVASTRKVYEKKLQKLLDQPPVEPEAPTDVTVLPKADSNQNGNTNSDQYSDKEDEEITAPEPEAVPVVEKPVRSGGKAPVTVRTSSRRQAKVVEEVVVTEESPKKKTAESVVEDILANEISTPTGISATCRRPIRGAAGRPVKPGDYWLDESRVQRTIHTESRTYSESFTRGGSVTVSSSKAPARRGFLSVLLKLLLLIAVVAGLYYAYQNLDASHINTLKGLLDGVVVPLQGVVENAATYLGISGDGATQSTDK